jgi:hypothetical protein
LRIRILPELVAQPGAQDVGRQPAAREEVIAAEEGIARRAEIVMQVFKPRQPVAVPQPGFGAHARHRAESPACIRLGFDRRFAAGTGFHLEDVVGLGLDEPGPGRPGGAVEQHVGQYQVAEPRTSRA